MSRVCIVGGGNIGMAIASEITKNTDFEVVILSSRFHEIGKEIIAVEKESGQEYLSKIFFSTNDGNVAVRDSDVIIITVPAFSRKSVIERILPHIKENAIVGFIPGTGGIEFESIGLISKNITIFALDRVPMISRIDKSENKVNYSKKKSVRVCTIPKIKNGIAKKLVEKMLSIECGTLNSFLSVTFTPSNQILHTARLYTIFKDYNETTNYKKNIQFYSEWNDNSSEMLLACDDELRKVCDSIDELDLSDVIPLKVHYGAFDKKAMTDKIRSIKSFKEILSPMNKKGDIFLLDKNSRYFTEDFPFGLCILRGFAEILNVATPNIDTVLKWYQSLMRVEYFIDNKFIGKDLKDTNIPQNFGINKINDIYKFYKKI